MKYILLFTACLFFFDRFSYAQMSTIDSLSGLLKEKALEDSNRIDVYNDLSFYWARSNPAIGLAFADSALKLAEKKGYLSRKFNAINNQGINYWYLGNDSLAFHAQSQVLDYHIKNKNLAGEARMLNNLALLLYNKADFRRALEYHERANKLFEELNMTPNLINSLSNTGVVFLAIADYPKALDFFIKAFSKTDSTAYNENANLCTNIGLVYKNLGKLDLSEKFLENAIKWYELADHKQGLASAYSNLANILQMQEKFDLAESLYLKALHMNQEIGNHRRIASDFSNLATLYKSLHRHELAEVYLTKALDIYISLDDILNLSLLYLEQAALLDLSGKSKDNVLKLQQKALTYAKQAGAINRQMEAYKAISETLHDLGRPPQALEAYKNYVLFKDSIFNDKNEKSLVKLQVEYDFNLREQQIIAGHEMEKQVINAENQRQMLLTNLAIVIFLLCLLSGILIFVFYKKKVVSDQRSLKAEFQAQKSNLETKALKAQMNPHFIFNALSSISNFLLKNDSESADYYLNKFAHLIRLTLEFSDSEFVSIEEELKLLSFYVEIESMRLGKPIELNLQVDPDLDIQALKIPPLLMQPMIENAIWHGITNVDENGRIEIEIHKDQELLDIRIKDNGAGFQHRQLVEDKALFHKKSMGLKIVQERLELLPLPSSAKPDRIQWKKLPQGLEVKFQLPIIL